MNLRSSHLARTLAFALGLVLAVVPQGLAGPTFRVTLDQQAANAAITGRLYVFLSTRGGRDPIQGPNWFAPEPFYGMNVKDFEPGTARVINDLANGFPDVLSKLKPGKYRVQALLDQDFYYAHHAKGPGNVYSQVYTWDFDGTNFATPALLLDRVIKEQPFPESKHIREISFESKLLSQYHGRKVIDRAAVILPHGYQENPQRRYPVLYIVPGFGGSHRTALRYPPPQPVPAGETEMIRVMLSGQCKWGHHVYADSVTNGPRGQSLVEELIPLVDKQYRTIAAPTARFVNGHSSGGWSSLWLQVTYPDTFGGVWSTSPDPVDFRDWQQVDLYHTPPLSVYYTDNQQRRPLARRGREPVLWYDSFGKMDDALGRGGQLRSFEAVFSPLDKYSQPAHMWDRGTGRVDPDVVAAWRKYDINLKLKENWDELGPKLKGKLHIITGELDTFYLEGAVKLLGETLQQLGSDAEVVIVTGADHGSVLSPQRNRVIRQQIAETFWRHHPK